MSREHTAVNGRVFNACRDEPALAAPADIATWVQYDLTVQLPGPAVYRTLGDILADALAAGLIDDGFFMHKPPGIRFRVRPVAPLAEAATRGVLDAMVHDGRIDGWRTAVYEPEQRLFGGPVSMRAVHRLFTADSLAWLRFHGGSTGTRPRSTVWALSLSMIRQLLDALEIVGWEDVDVWDRIGTTGGRVLSAAAAADPRVRLVGERIRAGWADPAALRAVLPAEAGALLEEHGRAIEEIGRTWRRDYFTAPGCVVGPRQAAAFAVIFHWNRAALPAYEQALITDRLASARDRG